MTGTITKDDGSSQPYKVKLPDGRWEWYKKDWVKKIKGTLDDVGKVVKIISCDN